MVYHFYIRLASRGIRFDYYFSPDVQYNPNGLIPALSPFLAFVVHILYGYFGFGFHYISTFITELWFSSVLSFFAGLVPLGYQLMFGESVESLMRELVYMGVRWHPDLAMMTHYLGYVGAYGLLRLGYLQKHLTSVSRRCDDFGFLLCYSPSNGFVSSWAVCGCFECISVNCDAAAIYLDRAVNASN